MSGLLLKKQRLFLEKNTIIVIPKDIKTSYRNITITKKTNKMYCNKILKVIDNEGNYEEIGCWNSTFSVFLSKSDYYANDKLMNDVVIKTGTVLTHLRGQNIENYMHDQKWKEYDSMAKFHYALFELLRMIHNFTYY